MPGRCLLYYITDCTAFPGDDNACRRRLLERIEEAARRGVDYIQLREKDLPGRELEALTYEAIAAIRQGRKRAAHHGPLATALLINSRTDIALAAGADGVHLRSDDISPEEVRKVWKCGAGALAREDSPRDPIVAVSCHSPEEVAQAASGGANFAVFAPVFEKKDTPDARTGGLSQLAEACRAKIPVLALGGVTLESAYSCLEAGAAGIAAIRLFQENDIDEIVKKLR
jgi:thiamine-phosphate pyrophosphorylase